MKQVGRGYRKVSEAAAIKSESIDGAHEELNLEVGIEEPGYLFTYLSHEGEENVDVYFDDYSVAVAAGPVVQIDDYYPYGMSFRQQASEHEVLTRYGFQGKELVEETGWYDFHARMYSPALGRFLAVDPQGQFASPYVGMGNNPVVMVDPDGELAFLAVVGIAAAIGAISGGIHASNDPNMSIGGGIWRGALIGAAAGAAGGGISALGAGAMFAGAAGGAVGGAGFSGLSSGWNGQAMLRGGLIGAASGFVGGGFASAIGGGGGAFAGGIAGDITGQLLSTGDVNLGQSLVAGGLSFGMYHGMSYASWKWGGGNMLGSHKLSYEQFAKINTAYQRSRFWKNEHGVILNRDGSARFTPKTARHKFHVDMRMNPGNGDFGTVHTHWAKPGVDWVDIGSTGASYERYYSNRSYPQGSTLHRTVGNSHSPGDLRLPGLSGVVGRTGSSYYYGMGNPTTIQNDPFLRFFLFPWLKF